MEIGSPNTYLLRVRNKGTWRVLRNALLENLFHIINWVNLGILKNKLRNCFLIEPSLLFKFFKKEVQEDIDIYIFCLLVICWFCFYSLNMPPYSMIPLPEVLISIPYQNYPGDLVFLFNLHIGISILPF